MNLYAYVENDPVNWIDPTGLFLDTAAYEALMAEAAGVSSAAGKGSRLGPLGAAAGAILGPKSVGDGTLEGNQCEEDPCSKLYQQINDQINRNKRLYGDGTQGTHGLRYRFGEQITGADGPGTEKWQTRY